MKCGTTTLYHMLTRHPRIVVPRVKEPRFLQQGRFQQTSLSRYAREFDYRHGVASVRLAASALSTPVM